MNKKIKKIVDIVMYILLILCMGYQVTGGLWHEVAGCIMFVTFVIHLVLNGYWFRNFKKIAKNSFSNARTGMLFWTDIVLMIDMIVLAVTSVFISNNIFAALKLPVNDFIIRLHTFFAYFGLIVASVHIGCHWKGIIYGLTRHGIDGNNSFVKITSRILALVIAVLGVFFSFKRDIGKKMFYSSGSDSKGTDLAQTITAKNTPDVKIVAYSEAVEEGESLEDYLSRLRCTGCGKRCLLSSPGCGRGYSQAKQATDYYNKNSGTKQEEDENAPEYDSNVNVIKLSGEDNLFHLFTEFIPVTGLYIAGTYYLLEIVERKKDDRKRKNENA